MSKYKVDITGINTNDLIVLKNSEMIELFKRYQNGELYLKEQLVNGNLKLVLSLLKKYNNDKYNLDDLFQIGCVGLIKAIDNFDLSHNVMFSTYAVPLIVGEIKRYIRDNTSVRISRGIKDIAYNIIKYKEEYLNEYGKEPSTEEISKYLNIEPYQINLALDSLKDAVSIFEPIYNDGGDTIYLMDQIANKENNVDKDLLLSLKKALNNIKTRERDILIQRYIIGKTQMELANSLGISQAQISRIEKSAINNVKRLIK